MSCRNTRIVNAEEICDLHLKLLDLINNTSENVCAQITYKLEFEETDLFFSNTDAKNCFRIISD